VTSDETGHVSSGQQIRWSGDLGDPFFGFGKIQVALCKKSPGSPEVGQAVVKIPRSKRSRTTRTSTGTGTYLRTKLRTGDVPVSSSRYEGVYPNLELFLIWNQFGTLK
jgi:hypothetical protein